MNQAETSLNPNLLLAPLDWGLGHATRCIPVIRSLLQKNCNVFIGAEGRVRILLQQEFPQLSFVDLKGYDIRYSRNKWTLPFVIAEQIPKILSAIQYENGRLREIVKEHSIHGIISDNRYGLYHEGLPSVFITHQLMIKTGFGRIADDYLQKLNYDHINRFTECWVPDHKGPFNLAGELSHPKNLPSIPVSYTGPLSRLHQTTAEEKHLLFLLSGPEPQRTILEESIIEQLKDLDAPVVLVRGLPGEKDHPSLPGHVRVHNHLSAEELNEAIANASLVIARCGYSTVMDLATLKKKSILIPTPGQTEQQYLAKQLMQNNFALCIPQEKFRLKAALELSASFDYKFNTGVEENHLDACVQNFIDRIINN